MTAIRVTVLTPCKSVFFGNVTVLTQNVTVLTPNMTKVTSIDCHARHSFDPKNVTVSTPNTLLHGVKTVTRMAVN